MQGQKVALAARPKAEAFRQKTITHTRTKSSSLGEAEGRGVLPENKNQHKDKKRTWVFTRKHVRLPERYARLPESIYVYLSPSGLGL